jgi:branched-chain amino acid transport system substrate-binding protein
MRMATVGGAFARGSRIGGRLLTALTLAAGLTVAAGSLSQTPASAASKAPLLIGDLCSCTGPEASTISQTTDVVQAWANSVNAKGGIDGHKVQITVKDDGYNPATSLAEAQALVEQDHVVAILDNSDEDSAWATYIQKAKVPVIGATESDTGFTNSDFFPPGGTFNYSDGAGAVAAKKAGVKKEASLYCVEVAICQQATEQGKPILAKEGIKVVYAAGIGFAAPNYSAECLAAKQSGADAMTVGDASAIVTKVAQNCATQGYSPRELSADGAVAIAWLGVPAMNGNIDVQADLPWFVHNAATKPMYAALAKYAPGVPKGPNFGEVVIQAWAAGVELQLAAEAGKIGATPTAAQITKGLYALPKGTTLEGLSPPISFVKGKPANNSCFYEMGIKNAKFVELGGDKPFCVPKSLATSS